jgi:large repetitive protein
MNEHDDLIARLRALGSQPVRPEVTGRHLAAIDAESAPVRGSTRSHRLRIVAAFAVGLLAGTSGLATAGALPDGAQEVAHRTLGAVGLNVPHGDRYQGPECGGEVKNHGQYVRSQPKGKRAEAAASRCGKPVQAGTGDDPTAGPGGQGGACQGPPPWAGKGKPDAAAKAARKQACGQGQDDDGDDKGTPAPAAGVQPAAPLTPETPPTADHATSTSQTTATTATTASTAPTTTASSAPAAIDTPVTTGTTQPTGTTTSTTGAAGHPAPSTPVDPPAVGQGS